MGLILVVCVTTTVNNVCSIDFYYTDGITVEIRPYLDNK